MDTESSILVSKLPTTTTSTTRHQVRTFVIHIVLSVRVIGGLSLVSLACRRGSLLLGRMRMDKCGSRSSMDTISRSRLGMEAKSAYSNLVLA